MEYAVRRKLRGHYTPPFGVLEHTRVFRLDSSLHCFFLWEEVYYISMALCSTSREDTLAFRWGGAFASKALLA